MRVVNQKSNTEPAIYYLGKTSPTDWPVEAALPGPIQMLRDIFGPLLKAAVGLTGLGVLIMLGKQLFAHESHPALGDGALRGEDDEPGNDQAS